MRIAAALINDELRTDRGDLKTRARVHGQSGRNAYETAINSGYDLELNNKNFLFYEDVVVV
jgi:hypothetical protein